MKIQNSTKQGITFFIILFIGFLLRIIAINWQLPYLYHTDEYRIINYALRMAATKSLNPKNFVYPSFYLYFMLCIYVIYFFIGKIFGIYRSEEDFAIKFFQDPTSIYVISRSVSAIFGTLTIGIVYLLAYKLYNKKVALISASITSFLPAFVMYSHYAKPDMAALFLGVVSFYFFLNYYLSEKRKFFYFACVFLGLAASTKYLPILIGVSFLYLYFKKNKQIDKVFFLGCLLIVLSFILTTPYSVLDYKIFLKDVFGHAMGNIKRDIITNVFINFKNYLFMGKTTIITGFICMLGFFGTLLLKQKTEKEKSLILIVILYFIVNSLHYLPGWWFLIFSFPFYIIISAKFFEKLINKFKFMKYYFVIFLALSFTESVCVVINFYLRDTRTYAVEWIEKNIPQGSKILLGMYSYSPQLKMTKSQLKRLYQKSVELNHYKKEYFYWQLKAHPGEDYGYEIYEIAYPVYEISTIRHEVEEAQKVRELVNIENGVEYVKQLGIKYIILNSFSETEYTKNFYKEVEQKGKLIKEFKPKTKLHPGPVIKIYKIL